MKNPFANEMPAVSPEDEASAHGLFEPLGAVAPSEAGLSRIRGTLANALSAALAPRPASPTMRRIAFTSAAVTAPLMAVSAVGAVTGNEPLARPLDFVSNAVGLSNAETRVGANAVAAVTPAASASASVSASATSDGSAAAIARGAAVQIGAGAAEDAHGDGNGCDDVNPAVQGTPTPGGPADCEAGNSGDHRQNGKEHGKPTAAASAAAGISIPMPTAAIGLTGQGAGAVNVGVRGGGRN